MWSRSRAGTLNGQTTCTQDCENWVERTLWDGDQVLYEIRYPGGDNISATLLERDTVAIDTVNSNYGRIAYTHAAGIDQPLDFIRMSYGGETANRKYGGSWIDPQAIIPHANWRGLWDQGSFTNGTAQRCRTYTPAFPEGLNCIGVDWPAPRVEIRQTRSVR